MYVKPSIGFPHKSMQQRAFPVPHVSTVTELFTIVTTLHGTPDNLATISGIVEHFVLKLPLL
jgi:hypothetical protein